MIHFDEHQKIVQYGEHDSIAQNGSERRRGHLPDVARRGRFLRLPVPPGRTPPLADRISRRAGLRWRGRDPLRRYARRQWIPGRRGIGRRPRELPEPRLRHERRHHRTPRLAGSRRRAPGQRRNHGLLPNRRIVRATVAPVLRLRRRHARLLDQRRRGRPDGRGPHRYRRFRGGRSLPRDPHRHGPP